MNFESGLASVLKANLIPIALGGAGIILVLIGVIALFSKNDSSPTLEFEAGGSNEASSSAASSGDIVIDIQGAVISPGVYTLPQNSRVKDLLVASGGLSEDADREWAAKNLNQAAKLSDGQKIYIYRIGEEILEGTSTSLGASSLVDINSASISDLDSLPGIGPVTAQKIVDQRPFASVSDLLNKKTVSASVFEKIKDKITTN